MKLAEQLTILRIMRTGYIQHGALMAVAGLLTAMPLLAQEPDEKALFLMKKADEKALLLMQEGDGLALHQFMAEQKDSLGEGIGALAEAFVRGCQGDAKQGEKMMRRALKRYHDLLDDDMTAQLTFGTALQQHRQGRNRRAVKTLSSFLSERDSFRMKPVFRQYEQIFRVLQTHKTKWKGATDASIPFRMDSVGAADARSVAVILPTIVNAQTVDMMFDTGATMNVVTRSMAEKLGLEITHVPIILDGMGKNRGWMAVAKSLRIGNMEGRNVPFCVIEEANNEDETSATTHQKAIIGMQLLQEIGCAELDFKSKTLRAIEDVRMDEHNLSCGFSENGLLLTARHHGNRLRLIPDMGATHSAVNVADLPGQQHYLSDYLPRRDVQFVGWGGTISGHEFLYPLFDISIGSTEVTLPQMSVFDGARYDSRLGMDFFSRCERVTFRMRYPAGMSIITWH